MVQTIAVLYMTLLMSIDLRVWTTLMMIMVIKFVRSTSGSLLYKHTTFTFRLVVYYF